MSRYDRSPTDRFFTPDNSISGRPLPRAWRQPTRTSLDLEALHYQGARQDTVDAATWARLHALVDLESGRFELDAAGRLVFRPVRVMS